MTKSTSKLFQSEAPKEMKEDAMNLPATVNEQKEELANTTDDIQDIDLSATKKKRFRINGDPNKIIELNTSDLNISSRLTSAYERLTQYMKEVGNVLTDVPDEADDINEEQEKLIETKLSEIDAKMREEMDYIFNAPVSEVCADDGSMYDPFEGSFRFEHIIDALSRLYETNLNNEFNKMKKKISLKTSKYTKKYHN